MTSSLPSTSRGPLRRFVKRAKGNWLERHQLAFNFWIHMFGIPLAFLGVFLLMTPAPWYWGVGGFVLGYLFQWIGHLAEGNDLGEWAGIKRMLGLPYVGISPRWQKQQENSSSG
ncbi:MAG TPA: Mpo1-like protein [Gemmataceae bacterium]|jgi:hypothetical protein|nr:Mpo1-like protein [Gemmataceae bacterium]